jgi:hypothetical protein
MLQINLQADQHLSPQVHEDLYKAAVVVWHLITDWKLESKLT